MICTLRISRGAFLPGMRAVVMIISTSRACLANRACSASMNSFDISFPYPPVDSPSSCTKQCYISVNRTSWLPEYPVENKTQHKPFLTLMDTSRNSAPSDSTCSFTEARVSNARTIAPMFLA